MNCDGHIQLITEFRKRTQLSAPCVIMQLLNEVVNLAQYVTVRQGAPQFFR